MTTRSALDGHYILLCYGDIVGCHCGLMRHEDDPYADAVLEHIYDLGFLDGITARSEG